MLRPPPTIHRLSFINAAWTPYHAVEEATQRLLAAGFQHVAEKDAWSLAPGVDRCGCVAWGFLVCAPSMVVVLGSVQCLSNLLLRTA
jgi:hypothetical protein